MRRISLTAGTLGLFLLAAQAAAVKPASWAFSTEKDFEQGHFENTVVDSHGQLTLGREMKPIQTLKDADMVAGLVQTPDGDVFAALNPDGKIFRLHAGNATLLYTAPKNNEGGADITALGIDNKGNLLAALAGDKPRLLRIDPSAKSPPATLFENDKVQFIWAILAAPDGALYLGTGPNGNVYKIDPAGSTSGTVVLHAPAKNIMALAFDKAGNLIAGTDAKGLVIRVDAKTQKPFVLLDAGAVDINALALDKTGTLYVATAKVEEADEKDTEPEEPETKSKPAAPEPERVEPAPDDKAGDKAGMAPPFLQNGALVLAANEPPLPAEIKKLLAHALADKGKPPTTKKKPGLPRPPSESQRARSGPESQSPGAGDESEEAGTSAVYRISPDGAVRKLLDDGEMNYSLALSGDGGGDLLIGTGKAGKLFRYRLADETLTLLARLKEEQITALLDTKDGAVFVGTANRGNLYQLGSTIAKTGTFTSQVLDASHWADWGSAAADANLPPGTKITIATRTGNTRSVKGGDDKFWSDWSPEMPASPGQKVTSPGARCLQFRVTLTADSGASPEVDRVRVGYQTRNLPPHIKNVLVSTAGSASSDSDADDGGDPGDADDRTQDADVPPKTAQVAWEASDPNSDALVFRLVYRQVPADGKPTPWTPLARNVKMPVYEWDTRALADGKYQVKVIASDKPDNAAADAQETARVSVPFVVDHTPPVFSDVKAGATANKATLSGTASDAASTVVDVRYQIDGQGDWHPAAASDKIFDSAHEPFTIVTAPLSAGAHRISLRATDSQGNSGYQTLTVDVK